MRGVRDLLVSFLTAWKKQTNKKALRQQLIGGSYLVSLLIGAVQPGWESDSSSVKPEGGDGSTISDGKSFCVSIRRGTLGCACHLVSY